MKVNDFTIQKYNEHDGLVHILVVEPANQNIYSSLDKNIIAARSLDYNFKIVTVKEIIKLDNELYFYIEFKGKNIGFFKPNKSIILVPKKNVQVKIKRDAVFNNEINRYLNINQDNFEDKKSNIAYSKYYAIHEDVIYESILLMDEVLSFQKPIEINNLYKIIKKFKVKKDTMTFYNSEMTKKAKQLKASQKDYTSKYIMPSEHKVKFRYQGKDVWIKEEDIDIDYKIENYQLENIDEILLETLLFQYSNKLNDYHHYYLNILNEELNK